MTEKVDLAAYFARIGYEGARHPTLATLAALQVRHPAAIAFENLDPVLARPVTLDLPSLEEKLVRSGRGGYCFEQNGLFIRVLAELGFQVTGLSARVLRGRPEEQSPRSHMLIKVEIDGESYVADVGFGGLTPTAPLRLFETGEQETPHGLFRILPIGDDFDLQALAGGQWETQYRFSLDRYFLQDYESLNWYRATHPASPFVNNLMAARALPGRRLGLFNNQYTERDAAAAEEPLRRTLSSAGEIAEILESQFGIALPEPRAKIERALARILKPAQTTPRA
jgi:N-hydroxyarylamine O-acetyltransferase